MQIPSISTTSPDAFEPTLLPSSPLNENSSLPSFGKFASKLSSNGAQSSKSGTNSQHLDATSDVESGTSSDESEREGDSSKTSITAASSERATTNPSSRPTTSLNGIPAPKLIRPPRSERIMRRRALKRYLISAPPPVLVIHLKRFQQITKGPVALFGNFKKLDDYVSFPEYLDISSFIAPRKEEFGLGKKKKMPALDERGRSEFKEKPVKPAKQDWWKFGLDGDKGDDMQVVYRLNAVVVHIGSMVRFLMLVYTRRLMVAFYLAWWPLYCLYCAAYLYNPPIISRDRRPIQSHRLSGTTSAYYEKFVYRERRAPVVFCQRYNGSPCYFRRSFEG
jgi:hypothetical protein